MSIFSDVADFFAPVTGAIGDVASGITPGVGSLLSGGLSALGQSNTNQQNADIAASNNAWSAAQYANRYQTMTKDMMAAGLNPMLAYSQSAGAAPTAQQVQFQNPMAAGVTAMNQYAGAQQSQASASQSSAMVDQVNATTKKVLAETDNLPLQANQIRQTVQLLADQAALAAQKGETEVAVRHQIAASIKKIQAETGVLHLDIDAREALGNIGAQSRELKPVVDILRALIK
jgi:hypothetical protein